MKERINETTVKEEILKELSKTDIRQEPYKYLELLDGYELLELKDKQKARREGVKQKLDGS